MKPNALFWDGIAPSYAKRPIENMDAYEQTLERVASYLTPKARVLELGCGTGGTALRLAPHAGSILATDFSEGMIMQAEAREGVSNVRFQRTDAFDPGFSKGGFDVVLGMNLFHLIDDPGRAFARVHELLADGGLLIVKTPCIGGKGLGLKYGSLKLLLPLLQWVGKAPFVRYLSPQDCEREISDAGFRIIETGDYPVRPPNHFVVARKI